MGTKTTSQNILQIKDDQQVTIDFAGKTITACYVSGLGYVIQLNTVIELFGLPSEQSRKTILDLLEGHLTIVPTNNIVWLTIDEFHLIALRFYGLGNQIARQLFLKTKCVDLTMGFDDARAIQLNHIYYDNLHCTQTTSSLIRLLTEAWKEYISMALECPNWGKHTYLIYYALGWTPKYDQFRFQNNTAKFKSTFRKGFLTRYEQKQLKEAETRIKIYLNDFNMNLDAALNKLIDVYADYRAQLVSSLK